MKGSVSTRTAGVLYAASSYVLWGFLPLYFLALAPTGPWEVVGWRVVFAVAFCALLITVTRTWGRLWRIAKQPRLLVLTALAGGLIFLNWELFLFAALSGNIVETSLGYFINPLVMVLLGVTFLGERLRPLQWVALGVTAIAVLVIIFGYRHVPWVALSLAGTFGLYGLVKKKVGPTVDAVSGLTLESAWVVPLAVAQLVFVAQTTGLTIGNSGAGHTVLLIAAGAVTAIPLILFAAGTRRVGLSVIGMLQFIAPVLQFLIGILNNEPMPTARWIGFFIVWMAIVLFIVDLLWAGRHRHRAAVS